MIFVSLGTNDKSFKRLLDKIDKEISLGNIKDKVIVQSGYTKYESKNMDIIDLMPMDVFNKNISECDILITHGGVGTILDGLKLGKKIIAFPRLAKYQEHVNDHQAEFTKMVEKRMKNIICVEKIKELGIIINDYDNIIKNVNNKIASNNVAFCKEFQKIIDGLME